MNSKRTFEGFSDYKRRDSLLRSSWNQITAGFKSKPEPKSTWYETASGDVTPWRLVVNPIRAAILEAVKTGDKQLIEETVDGARAFCRELEADFVSLAPSTEEASIVALALEETENEGHANPIEMALASNPCPTEAERAIGPLRRQAKSLLALIERCQREARQPQMRRVM